MCPNGPVKIPGRPGSKNKDPLLFHQPRQLISSSERYGIPRVLDFNATARYKAVAIPNCLWHNDSAKSINTGSHGIP